MIDAEVVSEVSSLIRTVAQREVLPRFGRLAAGDITEKAPGDLVTVADRAAEDALAERLRALMPGSAVVGEEAVAADRSVLRLLDGDAPVWIIDPIDGTDNFVSGSPRFSTLIALAQGGQLQASWTYIPVFGTMATAVAGGGAYVDGERIGVRDAPSAPSDAELLRHLDVIVPQPKWWTAQERLRFNGLARHEIAVSYLDTSGIEYVQLAAGRRAAMVLTWEFPWDHAAGLLLHAEAGGVSTTADGAPFRLAGGNRLPFVAAPNRRVAAALHNALMLPRDAQTDGQAGARIDVSANGSRQSQGHPAGDAAAA
ncbi:MAG: inositol monophosphatase family protein [Actinocrinis sp.]